MPACDVGPCQRTSTTSTLIKGQGSHCSWRCPCAQRAVELVRMVEDTHPQPPSGPLRTTLGPHLRSARLLLGFSSFYQAFYSTTVLQTPNSETRDPRMLSLKP